MSLSVATPRPPAVPPEDPQDKEEPLPITWRRLGGRVSVVALILAALAALAQSLGTVAAGDLAEHPSVTGVIWLGGLLVGARALETLGRVLWAGVVGRAEGRLRVDLLDAALAQPVTALDEQGAGEILDRVDDDTHEVGTLSRREVWNALRTIFALLPMWVIGGLSWWPAWIAFPVVALLAWAVVRPVLPQVTQKRVAEEQAWTDQSAALEEGIAARDDVRTSGGQAFVLRRLAELSAEVHRRLDALLAAQVKVAFRASITLHALLAAIGVCGIALVLDGDLAVSRLVTLFLITTIFVGQIEQLSEQLPELQAGLGALVRLRSLYEAPREPSGGLELPAGPLDLRFADLDFAYPVDDDRPSRLVLDGVDLAVPAGATLALVGRSGSGKSTLVSLLSRAIEPPAGSVLLGGVDVRQVELGELRRAVGVVTQRTEILAGTLAENIALFSDVPRARLDAAVAELGIEQWVAGLPEGLDTLLGPGGTTLSAGEEQLVAFARLLVRDVRVVVLDEATARMDPRTEDLVVAASHRLLNGRTGLLVAHRLSTTARADLVAVLAEGRLVQAGPRAVLAQSPGPFADLLRSALSADDSVADGTPDGVPRRADGHSPSDDDTIGGARRVGDAPPSRAPRSLPSLAAGIWRAVAVRPAWGLWALVLFLGSSLSGAYGVVTAWLWGHLVAAAADARTDPLLLGGLVVSLLAGPALLRGAMRRYPRWWVEVLLRVRASVLTGQTQQRRLPASPPGEVAARAMDADRYALYADRWVDFVNGAIVVLVTLLLSQSLLAAGVLVAVMIGAALASTLGRPVAGRSAARAATARAGFGRALVSSIDSARTVKLAAATDDVRAHLRAVDDGRVTASITEQRVRALLDAVPLVVVQLGVVAAWTIYLLDGWGLATALLLSTTVLGFDYFGTVVGWVITEAPGTRSWQQAASGFAGGRDLMDLPAGVDLVAGTAPAPAPARPRRALQELVIRDLRAVHDDGTLGFGGSAASPEMRIGRGELVLLLGQVGSGKSSLLGALAGLVAHEGRIEWNGEVVDDPEEFLRPPHVAYVAQVPRVLSGTFADNVRLDHQRSVAAMADARLGADVERAGGVDARVGHRGVRLSGGQVQRLALARALATGSELLVADDVSSALDAATEVELWASLAALGTTVLGATSKRSALARADRVVVLVHGRIAAMGPWADLEPEWSHLAG